jgi:hypothetical protein
MGMMKFHTVRERNCVFALRGVYFRFVSRGGVCVRERKGGEEEEEVYSR